jgi:hypothetical protein
MNDTRFKVCFCLLVQVIFIQGTNRDNTLVAVLMVKNEAPVIEQTLQPFIDGGIRSYFIFDTGSTDNTQVVAKNFFKRHGITNAYVIEEPFIDFATSRNRALDLTEQYFPGALFMLMFDAEWHLHNIEGLLQFCEQERNATNKAYLIRILSSLDFYVGRLLRCKSGARFSGVVHEAVSAQKRVPSDIFFELRTTKYGAKKSRQRWVRDCEKLLAEHHKNPTNSRTVFYLAQTYECLGELELALYWYSMRKDLGGWDQENFVTVYRLGRLCEKLGRRTGDQHWSEQAIEYYMQAYWMRPCRIEPLVQMAIQSWDQQQFELSFFCAYIAAVAPYPQDVLFIEKPLYDFTRYDLLRRAARKCKRYAVVRWAKKQIKKGKQKIFTLPST